MMSNNVVNIILYSTTYCLHMFALLFHDEYDYFYQFVIWRVIVYSRIISSYSYCQLGPLCDFFGKRPRKSYGEKVVRSWSWPRVFTMRTTMKHKSYTEEYTCMLVVIIVCLVFDNIKWTSYCYDLPMNNSMMWYTNINQRNVIA